MNDAQHAIDALPVFQSLLAADRDALAASFVERRYSNGEAVESCVGDDPVVLGILLHGDIEWKGNGLDLTNLHEGESFGDLSTDYRFDSSVAVVARRDATVALFTRDAFMRFAAAHPEAVVSLLRSFATSLRLMERHTLVCRARHPGLVRTLVARLVHRMFSH